MIGLRDLYGLGLRPGVAGQLPGNWDGWEVLIRPVMWIVCAAVVNGRSGNWRWW